MKDKWVRKSFDIFAIEEEKKLKEQKDKMDSEINRMKIIAKQRAKSQAYIADCVKNPEQIKKEQKRIIDEIEA